MLTRGNNMGNTEKNQLENVEEKNEPETGKIVDNRNRNNNNVLVDVSEVNNTPQEVGSSASTSANPSVPVDSNRKRPTKDENDGLTSTASRTSINSPNKRKRPLVEDFEDDDRTNKRSQNSRHVQDAYDAESEQSSSDTEVEVQIPNIAAAAEMPIEGMAPVLEDDVFDGYAGRAFWYINLQDITLSDLSDIEDIAPILERSASNVSNVIVWNCDSTILVSYNHDDESSDSTDNSISSTEDGNGMVVVRYFGIIVRQGIIVDGDNDENSDTSDRSYMVGSGEADDRSNADGSSDANGRNYADDRSDADGRNYADDRSDANGRNYADDSSDYMDYSSDTDSSSSSDESNSSDSGYSKSISSISSQYNLPDNDDDGYITDNAS